MACASTISWFDGAVENKPRPAILPEFFSWVDSRRQSGQRPVADRMPLDSATRQVATKKTQNQSASEADAARSGLLAKGMETQAEPNWSDVVRRCLSGESPAWNELVRAHHRRVYALCYRFTGSPTDAEDLTQEVFLKIYANLTSFDTGRGTLQVWITTLTRNLLVDHFRRTRNLRITGSLDEGWEQSGDDRPMIAMDRLEAKGPTQHDQATRRELEKMVQGALAQVSPELREAVILRDLQDMDYKEIAQVLGIPEGTVKSRISRGRAELARLLERNKREVM
jgi:RNA polymerase sigma-70 factor (ECF subfamily)